MPNQVYTVPPEKDGDAAGASFLAGIPQTQLALIGRTDLAANPYTRSLIASLNDLSEVDGRGQLSADGMVVYELAGHEHLAEL